MADGKPVVQIVVSRLQPGASRETFLGLMRRALDWLAVQPGFINYELYEIASGWAGRFEWATLEDAQNGGELFASTDIFATLKKLVEPDCRRILGRTVRL
jgi:hypothetical protein